MVTTESFHNSLLKQGVVTGGGIGLISTFIKSGGTVKFRLIIETVGHTVQGIGLHQRCGIARIFSKRIKSVIGSREIFLTKQRISQVIPGKRSVGA